jgi:hypothetical protein
MIITVRYDSECDEQKSCSVRNTSPHLLTYQNDTKQLLREIAQTRVVVEGTRTRYPDHNPKYPGILSWTTIMNSQDTRRFNLSHSATTSILSISLRQEAHSWMSLNSYCWMQWDRLGRRLRRPAWIAHQLLSLPQGRRSAWHFYDSFMSH